MNNHWAKLDVTTNEVDNVTNRVENLPTLVFWPAGVNKEKMTPLIFSKERNEENLLEFLKEEAVHPFKVKTDLWL